MSRSPTPITDVATATGQLLRIVKWTSQAFVLIQQTRRDWSFLSAEFDAALTIGDGRYSGADLSLTRFSQFKQSSMTSTGIYTPFTIYDPVVGRSDESGLSDISYEDWKSVYDRGTHDRNRPYSFAIAPDGGMCIGPFPDKAYRLRGEYRMSPQILAANGDVPAMPEEFHHLIWRRAVMLLAEHDEAPAQIATSQSEYNRGFMSLVNACAGRLT